MKIGASWVSSGKDAMLHSLSAQISYSSELIQNRPDWLYCGVYADEAKTGTKDSREEFQQLISDCRSGKVYIKTLDLIQRLGAGTAGKPSAARHSTDFTLSVECLAFLRSGEYPTRAAMFAPKRK